jgi:gamma-glutamyl hercynylcysteine S-oxide synthase
VSATTPWLDALAIRQAQADLLSLALIDSRNQLLQLLAQDETATALRLAARAGWFQEHWVALHVQRARGEACDASALRLASTQPEALRWHTAQTLPTPAQVRAYLQDTLETTLDLLRTAHNSDAGLYVYRLSLHQEDRLCEALRRHQNRASPPARAPRPALVVPAQRFTVGSAPGGYVPFNERWAHVETVPEFEIDAQPVNWQQFAEFAQDQGYDRADCWSPEGWAWLNAHPRRAPHLVEQLQGGVLVQRAAGLQRAAAGQAALHINHFEAQAWCSWAGRRLPTEAEWELAACTAASRGFVWGDVFEWVLGRARAWPGSEGATPPPGSIDRVPTEPGWATLRGASFATAARWRHPKARRHARAQACSLYAGFRSCAL